MNPEQIQQIVETIKTLNLNIDSNTAVGIAKAIMPYFYMVLLKEFIIALVGVIGAVIIVKATIKGMINYKNIND